jgi:hypothetical protein
MADLTKLRQILLDLKAPEDFLRQYPQLAAKVVTAIGKAEGLVTGAESTPTKEK